MRTCRASTAAARTSTSWSAATTWTSPVSRATAGGSRCSAAAPGRSSRAPPRSGPPLVQLVDLDCCDVRVGRDVALVVEGRVAREDDLPVAGERGRAGDGYRAVVLRRGNAELPANRVEERQGRTAAFEHTPEIRVVQVGPAEVLHGRPHQVAPGR